MIYFDIKDLYVNIPIDETLNIVKTKLLQNNIQITYQMLSLLKVILSQNYLMFQQKICQPLQGISMGSPISSLIAEIFLQHYEDANKKTTSGYQEHSTLCTICRWHFSHIWHNKNQLTHHQHIHKQNVMLCIFSC